MLKLKIGDNYLITTDKDASMRRFIIYCMSCFSNHKKTILGLDYNHARVNGFDDYLKAIKDSRLTELYVLIDDEDIMKNKNVVLLPNGRFKTIYENNFLADFVRMTHETINPDIIIKIVKTKNCQLTREYKLGEKLYDSLVINENSILSHLDKLDEYKSFATRYKAIPSELKVIDESIKKMSKEVKICERKIVADDLKYLDLIDNIDLDGQDLILTIKPLTINPSEPLGAYISYNTFRDNPYLRKAASYIYQGCHFGMVGTRIKIRPDFKPEFIETVDHQFDDMFKVSNWSSIGYLHFGLGHLCGGEFNDVIAHTGEHGLEYYFICLKQYITTANVRDYAGAKVWWYPIYDKDNNLIYCAGLDILRDYLVEHKLHGEDAERVKNMTIAEFQQWRLQMGVTFLNRTLPYASSDFNTNNTKGYDAFIDYCKKNDIELYKQIEEGANK